MNTWFEILNFAAMVASVLSFAAGVYALGKKKRVASLCFILLFVVTLILLIAQQSHVAVAVQTQHLQDDASVAPKQSIPSQIVEKNKIIGPSVQLRDASDHLKELQIRAASAQKRWQPTIERLNNLNQPIRSDISDALTRLTLYVELAQKALVEKDSRRAMKSIDLAERQLAFLEEQDPQ